MQALVDALKSQQEGGSGADPASESAEGQQLSKRVADIALEADQVGGGV